MKGLKNLKGLNGFKGVKGLMVPLASHSKIDGMIRCSIVVSISACHAEDPGSIPGGGVF